MQCQHLVNIFIWEFPLVMSSTNVQNGLDMIFKGSRQTDKLYFKITLPVSVAQCWHFVLNVTFPGIERTHIVIN